MYYKYIFVFYEGFSPWSASQFVADWSFRSAVAKIILVHFASQNPALKMYQLIHAAIQKRWSSRPLARHSFNIVQRWLDAFVVKPVFFTDKKCAKIA